MAEICAQGAPRSLIWETIVPAATRPGFEKDSNSIASFEPLLDSTEAAALLRIHPKTLQKLARSGEIAGIQIGRLWRFRVSALNRWLEKVAG